MKNSIISRRAKFALSVFLLFKLPTYVKAQDSLYHFEVAAGAGISNADALPFWLRANRFGAVTPAGFSGSLRAKAYRDYQALGSSRESRNVDWGFGVDAMANAGKESDLILIEAYAKARWSVFQLKAGRTKDVMGLNGDSTLTSGNFSLSGNALGIPKVEISIPEYFRVPVLDGIFSFKGSLAHGWVGRVQVLDSAGNPGPMNRMPETYLHQKSFYGRLGKADWRFQLEGGFNHQVFWGNERDIYGESFGLSPIETFFYVATGKPYGAKGVTRSKIGHQLGSVDLAASYSFDQLRLKVYRQNFYDVGALAKLANIADGLNGVSLTNLNYQAGAEGFQWKSILAELFYSKDQAGYPWSTPTKSGDEDYYNNFLYRTGWSYNGMGLGNPFITPKHEAREGQASNSADYFINNRVVALHTGLSGSYLGLEFMSKLSYSWNYGTFGTSIYGKSTGNIRGENQDNIFEEVKQFSGLLSCSKNLNNGYQIGFSAAVDIGDLLPSSSGLQLMLKKKF